MKIYMVIEESFEGVISMTPFDNEKEAREYIRRYKDYSGEDAADEIYIRTMTVHKTVEEARKGRWW